MYDVSTARLYYNIVPLQPTGLMMASTVKVNETLLKDVKFTHAFKDPYITISVLDVLGE